MDDKESRPLWARLCLIFIPSSILAKKHISCKWRVLFNTDPNPTWFPCYQIGLLRRKNMVANIYKYWLQSSPLEFKNIASWFFSDNSGEAVSFGQCTGLYLYSENCFVGWYTNIICQIIINIFAIQHEFL